MIRSGAVAAVEISNDEPEDGRHSGAGGEDDNKGAPTGSKLTRRRVLVVEDDYLVGLTICDLLAGSGYTVLGPAVTGEDAVALAMEERPDLVLMDIRLAGKMDGVDAAIAIADAGIRSIFVSAHSDPQTKGRAEAALPYGWVEKPFSDAQLIQAIHAALS